MQKVLIANRGEIAVRVIRACRDAGYASVAVYADPDRDALHVRMADEAFALGGNTPGESYLVIDEGHRRRRAVRRRRGPPRLRLPVRERRLRAGRHRRRPDLDRAVAAVDPRPRRQGDRPAHRDARRGPAGAGHEGPGRAGRTRCWRSRPEHGLPVAIKAAFGGGGRGLKIARTMEEIPELFDSAVREAQRGIRPGRVLRRAVPGQVAPRRGPGTGRSARQRHRRRHSRLLVAAPQPEAGRRGAGAVPHRRAARAASTAAPRRSAARPTTTARERSSTWSARTA